MTPKLHRHAGRPSEFVGVRHLSARFPSLAKMMFHQALVSEITSTHAPPGSQDAWCTKKESQNAEREK